MELQHRPPPLVPAGRRRPHGQVPQRQEAAQGALHHLRQVPREVLQRSLQHRDPEVPGGRGRGERLPHQDESELDRRQGLHGEREHHHRGDDAGAARGVHRRL